MTKSDSITTPSSRLESHHSRRLSPVKQLQVLENFNGQLVVFCNFDDDMEGEELEDVAVMRTAIQSFVDSIGILGYDDNSGGGVAALMESHIQLTQLDKRCLQYPWATPSISEVEEIVNVHGRKIMAEVQRMIGIPKSIYSSSNSRTKHPHTGLLTYNV